MSNHNKDKLSRLFLLITAIGMVHMLEQIAYGIEEYYMLRGFVGQWHAVFPQGWADQASVLLITIVFFCVSLMIYSVMSGGTAGAIVIGMFGLLGVGEAHHWIEAIVERSYDPGLVTSFPFVLVGALIVREVWSAVVPVVRAAPTSEGA